MPKTISITVKGKVQGVYFRQATREIAGQEGITGFVKNMTDGSVWIVATGDQHQLEKLLNWCSTGPIRAQVTEVLSSEIDYRDYADFRIDR